MLRRGENDDNDQHGVDDVVVHDDNVEINDGGDNENDDDDVKMRMKWRRVERNKDNHMGSFFLIRHFRLKGGMPISYAVISPDMYNILIRKAARNDHSTLHERLTMSF